MATKLVFKAADIFERENLTQTLADQGITTFGPDDSVNVIYPQSPHLYLGGVSALTDGYPIFVHEDQWEDACRILKEWEARHSDKITSPVQDSPEEGEYQAPYIRRFYILSILSFFLPLLPVPLALYYFGKSLSQKETLSMVKVVVSILLLSMSVFTSSYWINYLTHVLKP